MPRITLFPQQTFFDGKKKDNLLESLHAQGIPVGSACGGNGLCASCKIRVLEGQRNLSRPNDRELDLAERNNLQKDERISCQTAIKGDITITTEYWDAEDVGQSQNEEDS